MSEPTVVTSENRAEFMEARMGLKAPIEEPANTEKAGENTPAETTSEEIPTVETHEDHAKKEGKLQKRFSELTKARDDAKADADRVRAEKEALEARIREYEKPKTVEPAKEKSGEPQPNDFTDAFEYAKALSKYTTEQAMANRDAQEVQRREEIERTKVVEAWYGRIEKVKSEIDDYDEIVIGSDVNVSDQVRDAIIESDLGPEIVYYLAKNPEEAVKINGLSIQSALKAIGKIEAKLEKAENKEPSKVEVSKAPKPISPIKGKSTEAEMVSEDGEFKGTYSAYKAARKAGKIR